MDRTTRAFEVVLPNEPVALDLTRLYAHLQVFPDRRARRDVRSPLPLLIAVLANLSGQHQGRAIAEWARLRAEELAVLFHVLRATMPHPTTTSGVPFPCEMDTVERWIAENKTAEPRELTFVIVYQQHAVGACILKKICRREQRAELAYWLGPAYWGHGIGLQAAMHLHDYAFARLKLRRLDAHYLRDTNVASQCILAKLDFVPDPARPDMPVDGRLAQSFPP